jgi:D-sedoheptulose 7-phosphate isomerase
MSEPRAALNQELDEHLAAILGTVAESGGLITGVAERVGMCFEKGGKLLICGNGGSAADAQHAAAEFINRLRFDRRPLPAIALTTDSSVLTCIGNDLDFAEVFARQVEALGRPGDILLALSTSGRSANVLAALRAARGREMFTVGLTGERGVEPMSSECDILIAVPARDTARIQECHEFVTHFIAGWVENRLLALADPANVAVLGST